MFKELSYRKLKNSYGDIVYWIKENDLEGLKPYIDDAYSAALTLFTKFHKESRKKGVVNHNWEDVERMLKNLSTISHYFYGYYSNCQLLESNDLFNAGEYQSAKDAILTAEYTKHDLFKFQKSELNEPEFINAKTGKYCEGLQTIIDGYEKIMKIYIEKICNERIRIINGILKEIERKEEAERKEREEREAEEYALQKEREKEEYLRKCENEIERGLTHGKNYEYYNPRVSIDWYKSAYNWACEDEKFSNEKEQARSGVVDAYVYYIKEESSFFSHNTPEYKMSQCENGLKLCKEAYEWTHNWDRHKIETLESDLNYEYKKAYDEYRYET